MNWFEGLKHEFVHARNMIMTVVSPHHFVLYLGYPEQSFFCTLLHKSDKIDDSVTALGHFLK